MNILETTVGDGWRRRRRDPRVTAVGGCQECAGGRRRAPEHHRVLPGSRRQGGRSVGRCPSAVRPPRALTRRGGRRFRHTGNGRRVGHVQPRRRRAPRGGDAITIRPVVCVCVYMDGPFPISSPPSKVLSVLFYVCRTSMHTSMHLVCANSLATVEDGVCISVEASMSGAKRMD